jgi:hypothetical protein
VLDKIAESEEETGRTTEKRSGVTKTNAANGRHPTTKTKTSHIWPGVHRAHDVTAPITEIPPTSAARRIVVA